MGHIEISVKGIQVRFVGKHPNNYEWSFAGHKEDRLLIVWGLNGRNFYATFEDHIDEVFKEAGIDAMLCTMTLAHAKYAKKAMKDVFKIHDFGSAGTQERPMRFLLLRRKIKA